MVPFRPAKVPLCVSPRCARPRHEPRATYLSAGDAPAIRIGISSKSAKPASVLQVLHRRGHGRLRVSRPVQQPGVRSGDAAAHPQTVYSCGLGAKCGLPRIQVDTSRARASIEQDGSSITATLHGASCVIKKSSTTSFRAGGAVCDSRSRRSGHRGKPAQSQTRIIASARGVELTLLMSGRDAARHRRLERGCGAAAWSRWRSRDEYAAAGDVVRRDSHWHRQ